MATIFTKLLRETAANAGLPFPEQTTHNRTAEARPGALLDEISAAPTAVVEQEADPALASVLGAPLPSRETQSAQQAEARPRTSELSGTAQGSDPMRTPPPGSVPFWGALPRHTAPLNRNWNQRPA